MVGLEISELVYLAGVVGIGSFIRGGTGFGSSMIYIVGLTFTLGSGASKLPSIARKWHRQGRISRPRESGISGAPDIRSFTPGDNTTRGPIGPECRALA